jgi:hypothetical protein
MAKVNRKGGKKKNEERVEYRKKQVGPSGEDCAVTSCYFSVFNDD